MGGGGNGGECGAVGPPPDSKPPRKARIPSLDGAVGESDGRARAVAAVVERDVRAAIAAERPAMPLPRSRTPADDQLRQAIDEVRRTAPEWHVAEHVARSLDAIADHLDALAARLDAKDADYDKRIGAIEKVLDTLKGFIRGARARIAAIAVAAIGSVAAVIYGAGAKAGHEATVAATAAEQARAVRRHGLTLQRVCARDRDQDARLDEHDHLLSLPSRRRPADTTNDLCTETTTP